MSTSLASPGERFHHTNHHLLLQDTQVFGRWKFVGEGRSSLVIAPMRGKDDNMGGTAFLVAIQKVLIAQLESQQQQMPADTTIPQYLLDGRFVLRLKKTLVGQPAKLYEAPTAAMELSESSHQRQQALVEEQLSPQAMRCSTCARALKPFLGSQHLVPLWCRKTENTHLHGEASGGASCCRIELFSAHCDNSDDESVIHREIFCTSANEALDAGLCLTNALLMPNLLAPIHISKQLQSNMGRQQPEAMSAAGAQPSPPTPPAAATTFSLELKPKGPTLVLVHQHHRHQDTSASSGSPTCCRFGMMQWRKWEKAQSKKKKMNNTSNNNCNADAEGNFVFSHYCPNDLFATHQVEKRMYKALKGLLETPQNNLKMWRNERQVLPSAAFAASGDEMNEAMLQALCVALANSKVLEEILTVQAQSYGVDAERLLGLLGSKETKEGEKLGDDSGVDQMERQDVKAGGQKNNVMEVVVSDGCSCQQRTTQTCSSEAEEMHETKPFRCTVRNTLSQNSTSIPGPSRIQQLVEHFYAATTAKDCSIMLSIASAPEQSWRKGAENGQQWSDIEEVRGEETDEAVVLFVPMKAVQQYFPGNTFAPDGDSHPPGFVCRVAVIDIDDKKSKSLEHYRELETEIRAAYARRTQEEGAM